jgi:ERCC4-type nuclease
VLNGRDLKITATLNEIKKIIGRGETSISEIRQILAQQIETIKK